MFITGKIQHFRILTVLKLTWPKAVRSTGPRAFHALSFKEDGASDYYYEGKTAHTNKNDILFCPKGVGYTQKHEAATVYVVHFDCPEGIESQEFEVFSPENTDHIRELFVQMYEIWNSRTTGYEYFVQSLFYMVLYMLIQNPDDSNPYSARGRIENLIGYIEKYINDTNLSVHRLSELFGTSDSYLRRIFLEKTGMTPYQYITEMRISNAKSLLKTGYFSVTEVAQKSGFRDQKYFSRFFRKKTGMTPSDYEKKHLNNESEL